MSKSSILILSFFIVLCNSANCGEYCKDCVTSSTYPQFTCTSCYNDTTQVLILRSCSVRQANLAPLFLIVGILTFLCYAINVFFGNGMYRDIYEGIQLVSIIYWRIGQNKGVQYLEITNLALQFSNSYWWSYGPQMMVILLIYILFLVTLIMSYKYPHSQTSILFLRKKIVFPTRIMTFTFNFIHYMALASLWANGFQIFVWYDTFLALMGLVLIYTVIIVMLIIVNTQRISLKDPNYFVYTQKLMSKKWWVRNVTFFHIICRFAIILTFVAGFEMPIVSGNIILALQLFYLAYYSIFIRFVKWRYYIFNVIGQILISILLGFSYWIAVIAQSEQQNVRNILQIAYIILILSLCVFLIFIYMLQLFILRAVVKKQIISFINRFILKKEAINPVQKNQFDEHYDQEPVTQFKKNLLFKKKIIEMQKIQRDNSF